MRTVTHPESRPGLVNAHVQRGSGYVIFGGKKVTKCLVWTHTKIKVRVPNGTAKGKVKVTVKTEAGASRAQTFTCK